MNAAFDMPAEVFDLSGDWDLQDIEGAHSAVMAVPGDVHSALVAAEIIPHPYRGRNEELVQWVAGRDWSIRREFEISKTHADGWYLDITFLDTIAEIRINGALVLEAANTFRRFRPDVSDALKSGSNVIEIVFRSNIAAAAELQGKQPFYIPYSTGNCPIPNGNMLRKPQCHFGWDWNIAIAPFGLYGSITLKRMTAARIEHVQAAQVHAEDFSSAEVEVTVTLATLRKGTVSVALSFAGEHRVAALNCEPGRQVHVTRFRLEKPMLWWPAGHGAQHLYPLTISLEGQSEQRSIGIRKMELITEPDEAGSRFAFKVNGQEIFCRGANWIPADAMPSAATPQLTERLLQAAVDANMNMIRVWGGGFYEQNFFYDLCDRLGLLVWQDFMFACNLYPSTPEFLANVKEEVDYQVRRLNHHACLALWCGDNELIGALNWFEESRKNRDRYLVSYDRLNRAIEESMKAAEPGALWWPSSPSPGVLSFGDAWHDDSSGDMHFWSVWHEGRSFEHYRDVRPRFCSEFGFQSFPSLAIAKQFASGDDLNIASPVMEAHQKNAGGNARIAETMFRYFRFPMDFGNFVYVSQVQQALAIKTAVDYWRSLKPHCMGTLYWQLNDTWPVASWASLDHGGSWKLMHYLARDFFQPVNVSAIPSLDGAAIRLVAVNDTNAPVTVEAEAFSMSAQGEMRSISTIQGTAAPDRAVDLSWLAGSDIGEGRLLYYRFKASNGMIGSGHFSPTPYKALALEAPSVLIDAKAAGARAHVTLSAKKLAFFVWLECDEAGHFSDNGFMLLPGETKRVVFTATDANSAKIAAQTLIFRDLHSSYAGHKEAKT